MKKITFRKCEQVLADQDITNLENRLGAKLPEDFVAHYKKHNGGYPNMNWSSGVEINYPFESFLPITYGEDTIEKKLQEFDNIGFNYGTKIPFAVIEIEDVFCIDLSEEYYGQIFVRVPKYVKGEYNLHKGDWEYHCASFTEFLEGLNQINYYLFEYRDGRQAEIWEELMANNNLSKAILPLKDIHAVLKETIRMAKININIIFGQLQACGYQFNSETSVKEPDAEIESKIETLKNLIKPYGYLPLSLEFFLRYAGSVNFIPSWKSKLPYQYADSLYIADIDEIIVLAEAREWDEEEDDSPLYLEISPDYYHKDNVSGGMPYGIEITREPQIDSRLLNTPYGDLYFIDYLRLCFDWGGFPHIKNENKNYQEFIENLVKRRMTL
ncbi:SMI1/KNR4 family protein [Bacteroides sp. 224]|uniref:SMI1/KNR4 family protein n=1 Tax=Bacteroides sp. 224 TaxID=2302936 RepID=UPI0013D2FDD3|nr:SMI1/KNR4 family protein [Bacteroides sp. 224]NDV65020.1 SMI1/KNR4 family protein [Bacteroides sp. 224]